MMITINTESYDSMQAALEYIGRELGFPAYFRPNLDALNDCLSEIFSDVTLRFLIGRNADWVGKVVAVAEAAAERRTGLCVETIELGHYRHFKGGDYEVVGFGRHSETTEYMVIYKALYDNGSIWVRPAGMWNEEVTVEGVEVPRFRKMPDM